MIQIIKTPLHELLHYRCGEVCVLLILGAMLSGAVAPGSRVSQGKLVLGESPHKIQVTYNPFEE